MKLAAVLRAAAGAAALAFLLGQSPARAQSEAVVVSSCGAPPTSLPVGQVVPITIDSSGTLCTKGGNSSPYAYTSTGYLQATGITTVYTLAPPAGSTTCYVIGELEPFRYRTDGTSPTTSVGVPLSQGVQATFSMSTTNLANVKLIPTTGTGALDIDCYK